MAVTITKPVTEIKSTTNTNSYAFGSFTPGANDTLVILVFARTFTGTCSITNTSGTSLTWTQKGTTTMNGGADTIFVFWANTGASTAASVYTVALSGNAAGLFGYMVQVAGSDLITADPIKQLVFNTGTSTNPTTGTLGTAADTLNGNIAAWMGGLGTGADPANVSTAPGSWTEDTDNGFATPTSNASLAHRNSGQSGTTAIAFTAATTTWGLAFVEVYVQGNGVEGRRVTQAAIEPVISANTAATNARITQDAAEVVITPGAADALTTLMGVEVVLQHPALGAGVTQLAIEPTIVGSSSNARLTQEGIEPTIVGSSSNALITQAAIEVTEAGGPSQALLTQVGAEVVVQRTTSIAGVTQVGIEVVLQVIHATANTRAYAKFVGL